MGTCITKINTCEGNIDLAGINFTRKNDILKRNFIPINDFNNNILDILADEYFNKLCNNSKMGNIYLNNESNYLQNKGLKIILKKNIIRKIMLIQNYFRRFFFTKKIFSDYVFVNQHKGKQENKFSNEISK